MLTSEWHEATDRRVDAHGAVLPFDANVTIYSESKLMINHEGCVNTLQEECDAFYAKFGRDGRNQGGNGKEFFGTKTTSFSGVP